MESHLLVSLSYAVRCGTYSTSAELAAEAEVEAEWAAMRAQGQEQVGKIEINSDPRAQLILEGFRINGMNMRDAYKGTLHWQSEDWGQEMFRVVKEIRVPKEILKCRAVSREINFSSKELIDHLRLEQKIYFEGVCMEEWRFEFGFVIPGSTNTWQQTIEAADESSMLPAELLNGKVTIETGFYDKDLLISKSLCKVWYV